MITSAQSIPRWIDVKNPIQIKEPLFPPNGRLNQKIALWKGDMTLLRIQSIVNAANETLCGGGGIDGAIHRAAGYGLLNECKGKYPEGCNPGDAKITEGHNLYAQYVIHTVGTRNREKDVLERCYRSCLDIAIQNNIQEICFCSISTGIFGYPMEDATLVALETTRQWLEKDDNASKIDLIVFCTFSQSDYNVYQEYTPLIFPQENIGETNESGFEKENKSEASTFQENEICEDEESAKLSNNFSNKDENSLKTEMNHIEDENKEGLVQGTTNQKQSNEKRESSQEASNEEYKQEQYNPEGISQNFQESQFDQKKFIFQDKKEELNEKELNQLGVVIQNPANEVVNKKESEQSKKILCTENKSDKDINQIENRRELIKETVNHQYSQQEVDPIDSSTKTTIPEVQQEVLSQQELTDRESKKELHQHHESEEKQPNETLNEEKQPNETLNEERQPNETLNEGTK